MAKKSRRSMSRKVRKASKKSRRASRRTGKKQRGGNYSPSQLSFLQGMEYRELHPAQFEQRGGAMLGYAPVTPGDQGLLPAELRASARVEPIDAADQFIKGMRDPPFDTMPVAAQKGGARRRRRASRKGRKASKKASKKASRKESRKESRKGRKASRKASRRAQRGGALLNGAPLSQPTMLLTPAQAAKAGTADFSNPLLKN